MNKGMDEEYFEEIKKMLLNLPQVSIINASSDIYHNVVKGYSIETIKDIIKMIDFIEQKEPTLSPVYQMNRNISHDEINNRTLFQHLYTNTFKVYLKISLN